MSIAQKSAIAIAATCIQCYCITVGTLQYYWDDLCSMSGAIFISVQSMWEEWGVLGVHAYMIESPFVHRIDLARSSLQMKTSVYYETQFLNHEHVQTRAHVFLRVVVCKRNIDNVIKFKRVTSGTHRVVF